MAVLTKAQTRTAVRQAIDDPSSNRWSDASLDILITMVEDTMWQAINDTFPWFLSNTETLAATAGAVALSALAKRFYRIQRLLKSSDSSEYQPKLYVEAVPQQSYYLLGANVVTDPSVGSGNLVITYSYLPTRFTDLATDATTLTDYPEGHEAALVYLSAAWAMTKGDAENMQQIARIADVSLEALLTHVARRSPIGALARVSTVKAAIVGQILGGTK